MFILIAILLLLIILSFYSNEKMTDNYNGYLNNTTSVIIQNNIYEKNEPIEILNLPQCEKNILVDYGLNINTINNNGIAVNQIINDPLLHTIEIDNINYNLVLVEFRKTNFTFDGKPIGLTLHLTHSDYNKQEKFNIIIPLDFVDDDENIETFKNLFYNKIDNFFTKHIPEALEKIDNKNIHLINDINNIGNVKKKTDYLKNKFNNLKNKFNLFIKYNRIYNIKDLNINKILHDQNQIPSYQCCKNTIGPVIHMNLCLLKVIIEKNNLFYIIKEENGNTNLIIEPNIFNENNGLLIRSYIDFDDNLIYLKN